MLRICLYGTGFEAGIKQVNTGTRDAMRLQMRGHARFPSCSGITSGSGLGDIRLHGHD